MDQRNLAVVWESHRSQELTSQCQICSAHPGNPRRGFSVEATQRIPTQRIRVAFPFKKNIDIHGVVFMAFPDLLETS